MARVSRTLQLASVAGICVSALSPMIAASPAAAGVPIAAPLPSSTADEVNLSPRVKAGQKMTFTLEFSRDDTLTLPKLDAPNAGDAEGRAPAVGSGQSQTRSTQQTIGYEVEIVEASESGTVVKLTVTSVKAQVKVGAREFLYDSSEAEIEDAVKNQLLMAAKPMIGAPFTIHFDSTGQATKVENPGVEVTNPQFVTYLEHITDEQLIRLRWSPVFFVKRDGAPAKVGAAWSQTETTEVAALGTISIVNDCTLESAKDGRASVAIKSRWEVGAPVEGAPKMKLTKLDVAGSGIWDTNDGIAREFRWKQAVEINGNAQGFEMTRSTGTEWTITRGGS